MIGVLPLQDPDNVTVYFSNRYRCGYGRMPEAYLHADSQKLHDWRICVYDKRFSIRVKGLDNTRDEIQGNDQVIFLGIVNGRIICSQLTFFKSLAYKFYTSLIYRFSKWLE